MRRLWVDEDRRALKSGPIGRNEQINVVEFAGPVNPPRIAVPLDPAYANAGDDQIECVAFFEGDRDPIPTTVGARGRALPHIWKRCGHNRRTGGRIDYQLGSSESRQRAEQRAAFMPLFQETYPGWINARKPQAHNWMNAPSGISGIPYDLSFSWPAGSDGYRLRVGLYISPTGAGAPDKVFEYLLSGRAEVEEAFGSELVWERLETDRSRRVCCFS
jgi:hypothetical protein